MTTDWTQAEIDDLMAERDAAIRERDEALAILRDLIKPGFNVMAYAAAADRARQLVGTP
jgi:hypothetical protein